MLAENPCPVGINSTSNADPEPAPGFVGRMSEQDYYLTEKAKREAEKTARVAQAEPLVSALERRLQQEDLFIRVLVETGIKERVLRSLLDRVPPRYAVMADYGTSEQEWTEALSALAAWLTAEKQQRKAKDSYAHTPTLRAIYSILTEAMEHSLLSVIVGGYGIGKSKSAETLAGERPRSHERRGAVLIEMRKADTTIAQCISRILKRLRHDSQARGSYQDLCNCLRPGDLLILDESQRLATCGNGAMVEIIRDLWTDTGAGIVLIGNPKIGDGRDRIIKNDTYGAFLSRAEVHQFDQSTPADVEAWMVWRGMSGLSLAKKLHKIACNPNAGEYGGLRGLEKLLSAATRNAPDTTDPTEMLARYLDAAKQVKS